MKSTKASQHPSANRLILVSLAAAALPFLATPSRAAAPGPGEEAVAVTVQFGDLNLHSRAGIDRLYERIIAAAKTVCGGDSDTRPLENWSRFRMCTRQSSARAVAAVGIPELAALYARKTGHAIDKRTLLAKR